MSRGSNRGKSVGGGRRSGVSNSLPDVMVERADHHVPRDLEPASQIIPDRDAQLIAGLGQTEECISAIAASIAACSGADLPPRDVTANVVFGAIGVERNL